MRQGRRKQSGGMCGTWWVGGIKAVEGIDGEWGAGYRGARVEEHWPASRARRRTWRQRKESAEVAAGRNGAREVQKSRVQGR
jgi:siroheme synthase (precorrin-2 oxidase/ferrochelatase)